MCILLVDNFKWAQNIIVNNFKGGYHYEKTRFLSLALTGTLCVSLLAGCGGSGDGGGAAQTPDAANTSAVQENTGSAFKLGGTGPLTGDAAIYGLAAQRGAQIAVDEIKEAGGDIQFALKYEDDVNVPRLRSTPTTP